MALQQIKERGALPMIDRGDIRQAIDRCSNIWASLLSMSDAWVIDMEVPMFICKIRVTAERQRD